MAAGSRLCAERLVQLGLVGCLASYTRSTGPASAEYALCRHCRPLRIRFFEPRAIVRGRPSVYYTITYRLSNGYALPALAFRRLLAARNPTRAS